MAHGLDHLHRNHGVIASGDVVIIAHLDSHPVRLGGRSDPLPGQPPLLFGGRDRADLGPAGGRADRQLAPPGADFQQPGTGADAGRIQQSVDLVALRVGQFGPRRRQAIEPRAGIRHGFVEELDEQIAGQVVVVRGDLAHRLGAAGVRRTRSGPARPPQRRQAQRRGQRGQHPDEVLRFPLGCHEGLTETDQPVPSQPAVQSVRVVHHQDGGLGVTTASLSAVGVDHSQRQAGDRAAQQSVATTADAAAAGPDGAGSTVGRRADLSS